jgi:hypothetical protein
VSCAGLQTVSPIEQRTVVSIPAGACVGGGSPCSADDPPSVSLMFRLENDPAYSTGSYTTRLVFTISSI